MEAINTEEKNAMDFQVYIICNDLDMVNKQHINLSWGMDTNMDTLQAIKNEN